jgi:hypothetical protein
LEEKWEEVVLAVRSSMDRKAGEKKNYFGNRNQKAFDFKKYTVL